MATTANTSAKGSDQGRKRVGGWERAFAITVTIVVVFMVVGPLALPPGVDNAHYVYLAQNLVQGRLSIDNVPSFYPDLVMWQGHTYLPLGPLPGVLLIPFLPVLLLGLPLVWIGYIFTLLNIWLFYRVLGQAGVTGERRQWALLLFFGSTAYLAVAVVGSSYFFAHITTLTFMLAAISEALGKRRPLVIGVLIGLAGMVRLTAIFSLPFFLWLLWRRNSSTLEEGDIAETGSDEQGVRDNSELEQPRSGKASVSYFALSVGLVLAGLAGPMLLLGVYNYLRFGSLLESGYNLATLGIPALRNARSYGLFSLAHIPKNLFFMLFEGPVPYPGENAPVLTFPYMVPSRWGMGLLYTSPALLYAFRSKLKSTFVQACLLGTISGMIPIITYYGIGWIQFGFRYALDFLPFVLLLAARGFPNPMPRLAKILALAGVAVCLWGSLWLLIWIFSITLS